MAEWNYNMNHISLNLPPSFQSQNSSPGSFFNHPVSAHFNFGDSSQSGISNSKFHLGSDPAHNRLHLTISSSHELSWEINRTVNKQHVVLPTIVTQPQQEWLNMANQRKLDQHFLDNFIQARVQPRNCLPSVQMNEYRYLVKEAKRLTDCLKVAQQVSEASWNPNNSHELEQLKQRLEFLKEQKEDLAKSKEIKEKFTRRKEKKEWLKRKKERQQKEVQEALVERENLHRLIDDKIEAVRRKELNRKRNQLNQVAKSEADTFLGEVRRKLNDTKRIIELLQSLRELRVLRARSLELQRALFSKQEDTDHFNSTLDKLDSMLQKKLGNYEEEENTMTSTLNEHDVLQTTEDKTVENIYGVRCTFLRINIKGNITTNS